MKKAKTKKPSAPFKVGTFQLGYKWVELWLDPNNYGGNFDWMPGECRDPKKHKEHSRITVGSKDDALWVTWGVLVHEAAESLLCDMGARMSPTGRYVRNCSDCYTFQFDHLIFSDFSAKLGSFLCECRAEFEKGWRTCH